MFDNKKGKHSHIFMSFACFSVLLLRFGSENWGMGILGCGLWVVN